MEGGSFAWEQSTLESQRGYIEHQLGAGVPVETVANDLAKMGIDLGNARSFILTMVPGMPSLQAQAPVYGSAFGTPAPAGVAPAAFVSAIPTSTVALVALGGGIAAGVVIGLIILAADLKVFFIATPLGLLIGYAVKRAVPHGRGTRELAFALLGTALGVVVARYFVWVQAVRDTGREIARSYPAFHAPSTSSVLSNGKVLSLFFHHLSVAFGWRGLLTLVIGLVLAARVVTSD